MVLMNNTELNHSDRCLTVSCPEKTGSPALYILLYILSAAVVLFTLCGNLLVITSVLHFKQLHTPTNMLILSLAVSDFLVGALMLPPMFIWTIEACWIFGTSFCMYVILIGIFLVCLSVYHIVLIAVDRYFALSNPFLYNNMLSLRKIQAVIFLQWCVWLGYSSALLYSNGNLNDFKLCPGECFILKSFTMIIDLVISIIFPCTVIIILYTGVFLIAKKHVKKINNLTRSQTHKSSERKAAKVLGILVSVFLIFLIPYFIFSVLTTFTELEVDGFQIVIIVCSLNSTINPIIYALFYPWFRRCVKIVISLQVLQSGSSFINVLC